MVNKDKIIQADARYRQKTGVLLRELSQISEEKLNKHPANGGWSAIQTAWHLMLVEENAMAYVQKKLGYGGVFDKAGFRSLWRSFVLKAGLYLPFRYKSPKISSGDNLPERTAFGDL